MPRVKLFNQNEALQKAMLLFWEKGYKATSLTDLTNALDIGKGSFYATFKGKRALYDQALALYQNANIEMLATLLDSEPNVKKGLLKLLEHSLLMGGENDSRRGCFIANSCSELGGSDDVIQSFLVSHNDTVHNMLTDYINQARLPEGIKASQVADAVLTFLTGINQESKFKLDKARFVKSFETILRLLPD